MTPIRYKARPTYRVSEVVSRDGRKAREILVALEPAAILLRLKGCRTTLRLPLSVAFLKAAQLEADRVRAEKKTNRKTPVRRGRTS